MIYYDNEDVVAPSIQTTVVLEKRERERPRSHKVSQPKNLGKNLML
jgi:hypothetical protein